MVEIYRLGDVFFSERVPALLAQNNSLPAQIVDYFCLYAQLSLQNGIDMVRSLYVPTNQMFISHGRAMQEMLTDMLQSGQQQGKLSATLPAQRSPKNCLLWRAVLFLTGACIMGKPICWPKCATSCSGRSAATLFCPLL